MTTSTRARDSQGRFVRRDMTGTVGGRMVGESSGVAAADFDMDVVGEAMQILQTENYKLTERLENVDMMIDSQGWNPTFQYEDGTEGISLTQLRESSKQLREMVAANPVVKRGSQLRDTYVWGGGITFMCEYAPGSKKAGQAQALPVKVRTAMEHPRNDRYLFSDDAHEELERAAFTDGMVFVLFDPASSTFIRVPLAQITADVRDPENHEEVWAYRREWFPNPGFSTAPMVRWYYTDIYDGVRASTIYNPTTGKDERVEQGKTLVDKSFNRQVGWAYGVPDALSILAWARLYREFLVNGYVQSKALARIAFKVIASSAQGAANAAVAMGRPGEGNAAIMGGGTDLAPLATAGKGYDFDSGRPLAAMIAAGIEVSLVALLSDPGAGGGSYGTAQTLDAPTRASALMRQQSWGEFWRRIFRLLGLGSKLQITWGTMREDMIHREMQALVSADSTGLFESEKMQRKIAALLGWPDPGPVPEGRLLPNNSKSLPRKDIDTDADGGGSDESPTAGSGQGQSRPGGSAGDDHDDDTE